MLPTNTDPVSNWAHAYLDRGIAVIPVPFREKGATTPGWPKLRLTHDDVDAYFVVPTNIAMLNGEPSHDIIDIDLDDPTALALADKFLPPTDAVSGRAGNPRSHRFYRSSLKTQKYEAVERSAADSKQQRTMLVEVRGAGSATCLPPSIHPSGEPYIWYSEGEPAPVDAEELSRRVGALAAAAYLARRWAAEGSRHDFAMAAGGFLARGALDKDLVVQIVREAAGAAGDEQSEERARDAADSCDNYLAGKEVTGGPRLVELSGDEALVRQLQKWLDLEGPSLTPTSATPATVTGKLLKVASRAELFHDSRGRAFAAVRVHGHRQCYALASSAFNHWLRGEFFHAYRRSASEAAMRDVVATLTATALYEGPKRDVAVRVASIGDAIYIDLCDEKWRAVEVTSRGWTLVEEPPVYFERPHGLQALPEPVGGGSLEELRDFINMRSDDDFLLLVSAITAAYRPVGPYVVMVVTGEPGSAKSTTCRVISRLCDPKHAPLRSAPRSEQDLMIAARNGRLVAFENISHISTSLSDSLCRLATGGGFGTRTLYTNDEETLFDGQNPVLVNGVDLVMRGDLADRALVLDLASIADTDRRTEFRFWPDFEEAYPRIFGALLDVTSAGLRALPAVHLERLPRMADFAWWGVAVEQGNGFAPGTFMKAYGRNHEHTRSAVLEDPVALAIFELLDARPDGFGGTATEFLNELTRRASSVGVDPSSRYWPKAANTFSQRLKILGPHLRAEGVVIEYMRSTTKHRTRRISVKRFVADDGRFRTVENEPGDDTL